MLTTERLAEELVAEACQDEVGLWMIIAAVQNALLIHDPEEVKATTFDVIRRLLESGRVEAGHYNPDGSGIARWRMPTSEVLSRIDAEWTRLGRKPSIGEVVIFVAPSPPA